MASSCFGCNRKLTTFDKRANKKLILKAGGMPPEGMGDHDVLCDECLEPIRKAIQETGVLSKKFRSAWWYLLPLFLSIIGGIIAYFAIRKDDPKLAKDCLIVGAILFGIKIGLYVFIIVFSLVAS